MMNYLINFTETINPDNRFQYCNQDKTEEIIIGANALHTFELPFIYSTTAESAVVVYQQGLYTKFIFNITDDLIIEDKASGRSFIQLALSPEQTLQFKETILTTYCQLRVTLINGQVIYDIPHQIIVKKPLEI